MLSLKNSYLDNYGCGVNVNLPVLPYTAKLIGPPITTTKVNNAPRQAIPVLAIPTALEENSGSSLNVK